LLLKRTNLADNITVVLSVGYIEEVVVGATSSRRGAHLG